MPKEPIPDPMHQCDWADESRHRALKTVYDHVVKEAGGAIHWYVKARRTKKWGGLLIRGFALALVAAAGLLPVLTELLEGITGSATPSPWTDPLVASLAVGVAAARPPTPKPGPRPTPRSPGRSTWRSSTSTR